LAEQRTILITGAAGNLGGKLRRHLEQRGYPLRLLDYGPQADPAVLSADLAEWDDAWVESFAGVDTVLHLAAEPSPAADWPRLTRLNLDLLLNVMEATVQQRCRRFVFASSNWVLSGHRGGEGPLAPETPPNPVTPYGATKLFGERLGKSFAERRGLSVICFRIGYCQRQPGNRPGPQMGMGLWGQSMWLSDGDLCRGYEAAIEAPDDLRFAVLNLMSDNAGMRWDLGPTREAIGYVPGDRSTPEATETARVQEEFARRSRSLITDLERTLIGKNW
jgi:nucleoside-diphosphate-sugar epimerase